MLRHIRSHTRSFIEICKFSEVFGKPLTLERLYSRQSIFDDDDDGEFVERQNSFRNSRSRNSDRYSNYKSDFNNYKQNRRYDKSFHPNKNNRFTNNQSKIFGEELIDAQYDKNNLLPIEKFFYVEHPNVAQYSGEEIDSYRKSHSISVTGSDIPKPIMNFEELCIPDNLKTVVESKEFSKPTPIQAQGWPIALSGRDMVGISRTGSGKTLVFMIPAIIHALNQPQYKPKSNECAPQVLVLAPTRELVQQIFKVSTPFCDACELISTCAYGGASKNFQLRCLEGASICIATPGRLIDFISEGRLNMSKCTYLVLDEADRMLDMGFEPQIRKIIGQIRPNRQTLMWSATWPTEIQNLAEDFLTDYIKVTVGDGQLVANPNIEQNIYVVEELDKEERLKSLLKVLSAGKENKTLIFAQTKKTVDYLGMTLNQSGIKALVIHGDVSQARRDNVLDYFRRKNCILIATDVAARGLDISDVHHVINYDFPLNIEDYIHRIGRTARGDSSGVAHSFLTFDNVGIASELITVLKQAKQNISPDLFALAQRKAKTRGRPMMRPFSRQKYEYSY